MSDWRRCDGCGDQVKLTKDVCRETWVEMKLLEGSVLHFCGMSCVGQWLAEVRQETVGIVAP